MSGIRPSECGFDYLSTTWLNQIRDTALGNMRSVIKWAERRPRNIGWQGYIGYKIGQVCVGERLDGSIVRLEGKAADDWGNAGLPVGHNVTRLDIALTIWGIPNQSEVIARHNVEGVAHRKSLRNRPFAVRLIDGNGDGDTLYIGSRTSEQFVRIYDKERSPNGGEQYKEALRYECECKEQLALSAYQRCVSNGYSATSCLQVLAFLLSRRGVCPVGFGGIHHTVVPNSVIPASDLESSLSWLSVQVRPTVARLIREGYEEEVLTALGLARLFNPGY